jgi:hypothetical protein
MSYMKSKVGKPEAADFTVEQRRPCMICSKSTLTKTLSNYGARCFECFEHYCQAAPAADNGGARIPHNPLGGAMDRSWARRLQMREQLGEPLSKLQKTMWREALKRELAEPGNQS